MDIKKTKKTKEFFLFFKENIRELEISELKKELKERDFTIFYVKKEKTILCSALVYIKEKNHLRIRLVATEKKSRNLGYANETIKEIEKYCKNEKISKITLIIPIKNSKAIMMFIRNNYEIYGVIIKEKKVLLMKILNYLLQKD